MSTDRQPGRGRAAILAVDRFVAWLSRHWLALFNLVFGLYAGLPVLAPLLMTAGRPRLANLIYFVYQFLCHQLPSRSFYLGRFQVAICERDLALYGGACLAGIGFAVVRRRVKSLPLPVFLILIGPLILDGVTQLTGLRTSTWELRTLSGLLASGAAVWLVYPYLQQGFAEVANSASGEVGKPQPKNGARV